VITQALEAQSVGHITFELPIGQIPEWRPEAPHETPGREREIMAPEVDHTGDSLRGGEEGYVTFNQVLSELIDLIVEVKQAEWKVPKTHELRSELDQLYNDLVRWKTVLGDRDQALGVDPLSFMSSAAGRRLPNLWPGKPTDAEVRALVDEHLGQLEDHLLKVRMGQLDQVSRGILAEVQHGLQTHRGLL
jgi:hypothetical protein